MCESTDLISWVINCSEMISDSSFSSFRRGMRIGGSPCWQGSCAVHGGGPAVPSRLPQSTLRYSYAGASDVCSCASSCPMGWIFAKSKELKPGVNLFIPHVGSVQFYQWLQVYAPHLTSPGLFKALSASLAALFQIAPAGRHFLTVQKTHLFVGTVYSDHRRSVQACPAQASHWTMPLDSAMWSFSRRSERTMADNRHFKTTALISWAFLSLPVFGLGFFRLRFLPAWKKIGFHTRQLCHLSPSARLI